MTKQYMEVYLYQSAKGKRYTVPMPDHVVKITDSNGEDCIYVAPSGDFNVSVLSEKEFNETYSPKEIRLIDLL